MAGNTEANESLTGRLFKRFGPKRFGEGVDDFAFFVQCRRQQPFTEFEIALSIKQSIPDMRIELVLRDMKLIK